MSSANYFERDDILGDDSLAQYCLFSTAKNAIEKDDDCMPGATRTVQR
jgi:hypothetical protein